MLSGLSRRLAAAGLASPALTILLALLLATIAAVHAARELGMTSDTAALFPEELPWRRLAAEFDAAFPQRDDLLVAVIDAPTPEQAASAATALAGRLAEEPLLRSVRLPGGEDFFRRNGLLYLDLPSLRELAGGVVAAQPLLGRLAREPGLDVLLGTLATAGRAAARGELAWSRLEAPLEAIATSTAATLAGESRPLSWRSLLAAGADDGAGAPRRVLLLQPVLDHAALTPGAAASERVREVAAALGIIPEKGLRLRLTGPVALADEEFATVAEGTRLAAMLSLTLVAALLLMALRSVRRVLAVVLTLLTGLLLTLAFAATAVGTLNVISIAFVVLFVGLGVDFGIQFCVRLRARSAGRPLDRAALLETATAAGPPLALAALATAAGFLALTPTDYAGVAELGLIAGVGLGIAWLLSLTLLPALAVVLGGFTPAQPQAATAAGKPDAWLQHHRRAVLGAAAVVAVAGLLSLPRVQFDFDPLSLKDPGTESVATLAELAGNAGATPFTIDVLAASQAEATTLAARLETLPEVARTLTLESFVPGEQAAKLAVIDELALLLGPLSAPAEAPLPVVPDDVRAVAREAGEALGAAPVGSPALRLAGLLPRLQTADAATLERLARALLATLPVALRDLDLALQAHAVTVEALPEDVRRDWLAADGRARIEVFPAGDPRDNLTVRRFASAVREVAPRATGSPVTIQASADLVTGAFVQAGVIALAAIALLLAAVLRRPRDVLMVLAPLLLAGLATALLCALLPLRLNFANIIALPLLMGIGVSFSIYLVTDWRRGETRPLASPTARAVTFSALTTAAAFGSLAVSPHPGTASMGLLLALSLALTLAATLVFLPALAGPPPRRG